MTHFTETAQFETLRAYYIAWETAKNRAYHDGDKESGDVMAARCTGVLDSVMVLMGENLPDADARNHWTSRLRYGR